MAGRVIVFPRDPAHRLVGVDLAGFLDRLAERMLAVGDGAHAIVRAGSFEAATYDVPSMLAAVDAARDSAQGREDLEVRVSGDVREPFARFVGGRCAEAIFSAFVVAQDVGARPCAGCGRPLEAAGCPAGCGRKAGRGGLRSCWRLDLSGPGGADLGARFVAEARRLKGTSFFDGLEGTARALLHEWQPTR